MACGSASQVWQDEEGNRDKTEGTRAESREPAGSQDCATYGMGGAIHSTTVLRPTQWQWQKCNLVSCEGNRLDFAMACHTRHCATLEGQGRSRVRPSALPPLEGRAEPKTLDRLAKSGLPRLIVWPSPQVPQDLLARVHCIAVHGSGTASNVRGSAACQIVAARGRGFGRLPYRNVPFSFNKDSPRLMLEPWKCCAMVVP